jgi:hypothetical protein
MRIEMLLGKCPAHIIRHAGAQVFASGTQVEKSNLESREKMLVFSSVLSFTSWNVDGYDFGTALPGFIGHTDPHGMLPGRQSRFWNLNT